MTQIFSLRPNYGPAVADMLPEGVATPCFVILEETMLQNLAATAKACGGVHRLMPHVKTHRAEWIVRRLVQEGVPAFKTATVTEAATVLAAGARKLLWAYPTVNPAHIAAFLELARAYPGAALCALIDSAQGLSAWRAALEHSPPANLKLYVDLDPGMGRTGTPLDPSALVLARGARDLDAFGGWHVYDGHVQDRDIAVRRERVAAIVQDVRQLMSAAVAEGLCTEVIAGASYSFEFWPADVAAYVAPGSWTYSSSQHDTDLPHLQWQPAAYVLATVISRHGGTATLDAGSKAISPDKPMADRFRWNGRIVMMSEEHVVVEDNELAVGDRVMLMPRHACTTAYLYDRALVRTLEGGWESRPQLGNKR
jgi:D-serine deaminase-like pyridoxal phosphate-dependent protein